MKKVVLFTKQMLVIASFMLLFSCMNGHNDKDLLPVPEVKMGMAKLSGSVVNLKLKEGEKSVVLTVFVYNPITGSGDVSRIMATLNKDNEFSLNVPLECSAEVCAFNVGNESTNYGWGYIGLEQGNDVNLNLVFDEKGDMKIDTKGGLSFTADDVINITDAYGRFEDHHTWGAFETMNPKQFAEHELNISLKERLPAALDSLVFSDKIKNYLIDDLNLRFIKGRLFYYKVTVENAMQSLKISRTDTVIEPDKSYYTFLKDLKLNNPRYLYCEDYSEFLIRFLRISAFGIPPIKDMPIEQWLGIVKASVKDVVGFDSGLFYDMLVAKAYVMQMNIGQTPLTKQQISQIQDYFKNKKEDFSKLLLNSNKELVKNLEKNTDLKINATPAVAKEKLLDALIAKYKGSVVLVDFWATWCGPCMNAHQEMRPLKDVLRGKGVVFVYISNRSSPKTLWEAKIKLIGGEQYYLEGGEWEFIMESVGFEYIPSYLIYDKNGILKQKISSFPGVGKMSDYILPLLR